MEGERSLVEEDLCDEIVATKQTTHGSKLVRYISSAHTKKEAGESRSPEIGGTCTCFAFVDDML